MAEQAELLQMPAPRREQPFIDLPVPMIEEDALALGPIGIAVYAVLIFHDIKERDRPTVEQLCTLLGITPVAAQSALRRLTTLQYLDKDGNAAAT